MTKRLTKGQRVKLRAKASAKEFREEMKKSLNVAIVAAFGFLMALSWRDVITGYVNRIESVSPLEGSLISAIIITIISVAGILIFTRIFSESKR